MKEKKKWKICAIAGLLAALTAIGGVSAYFTDTDTSVTTFTVGKIEIDLQEPEWEAKEWAQNQTKEPHPCIWSNGNCSATHDPDWGKYYKLNIGENGGDGEEEDEKIIAVAKQDPFLNCYNDVTELPSHISAEIIHFFEVYKQLEGKQTMVDKILGRKEAEEIIEKCIENYNKKFG